MQPGTPSLIVEILIVLDEIRSGLATSLVSICRS